MVRLAFVIFICVIVIAGTGAGIGIAVQNSMDKNTSNETTEEKFKYDLLEIYYKLNLSIKCSF